MNTPLDPNNLKQMTDLGISVYKALPEDAKRNLFLPATESLGKTNKSFIDIIGYPFNALAIKANASLSLLEHQTNQKIEHLKEQNKYTEKKVGMAVKAIEESKYSLDSETLRDCFSNLITNSLNTDYSDIISPNFASILSNFTELDALFLQNIVRRIRAATSFGISDISFIDKKEQIRYIPYKNLVVWDNGIIDDHSKEIETMISFGLFQRGPELSDENEQSKYKMINTSHQFSELQELLDKDDEMQTEIEVINQAIFLTSLGVSFISLVLSE